MTSNASSKDVQTTTGHGSALVLAADQEMWTEQQLAGLRQLGIENAPEGDLRVFLHIAQRTGLDPFARQIHMIGRSTYNPETRTREMRYTIQTGIDGYRLIAARAAKRDGDVLEYEDTQWCGPDGQWVDAWVFRQPPAAARVTVLKNGNRFPATVTYAAYVQTYKNQQGDIVPNSMWSKMPAEQLAKCAEALALRKAYPNDLSLIKADEEMGQADNPPPAPSATVSGLSAARAKRRAPVVEQPVEDQAQPLDPGSDLAAALFGALNAAGVRTTDRLEYIGAEVGRTIPGGGDVTVADAELVLANLMGAEADTVDGEVVPDEGGE